MARAVEVTGEDSSGRGRGDFPSCLLEQGRAICNKLMLFHNPACPEPPCTVEPRQQGSRNANPTLYQGPQPHTVHTCWTKVSISCTSFAQPQANGQSRPQTPHFKEDSGLTLFTPAAWRPASPTPPCIAQSGLTVSHCHNPHTSTKLRPHTVHTCCADASISCTSLRCSSKRPSIALMDASCAALKLFSRPWVMRWGEDVMRRYECCAAMTITGGPEAMRGGWRQEGLLPPSLCWMRPAPP